MNLTQWWEKVEKMVQEVEKLESNPENQAEAKSEKYKKLKAAYMSMAKEGKQLEGHNKINVFTISAGVGRIEKTRMQAFSDTFTQDIDGPLSLALAKAYLKLQEEMTHVESTHPIVKQGIQENLSTIQKEAALLKGKIELYEKNNPQKAEEIKQLAPSIDLDKELKAVRRDPFTYYQTEKKRLIGENKELDFLMQIKNDLDMQAALKHLSQNINHTSAPNIMQYYQDNKTALEGLLNPEEQKALKTLLGKKTSLMYSETTKQKEIRDHLTKLFQKKAEQYTAQLQEHCSKKDAPIKLDASKISIADIAKQAKDILQGILREKGKPSEEHQTELAKTYVENLLVKNNILPADKKSTLYKKYQESSLSQELGALAKKRIASFLDSEKKEQMDQKQLDVCDFLILLKATYELSSGLSKFEKNKIKQCIDSIKKANSYSDVSIESLHRTLIEKQFFSFSSRDKNRSFAQLTNASAALIQAEQLRTTKSASNAAPAQKQSL